MFFTAIFTTFLRNLMNSGLPGQPRHHRRIVSRQGAQAVDEVRIRQEPDVEHQARGRRDALQIREALNLDGEMRLYPGTERSSQVKQP